MNFNEYPEVAKVAPGFLGSLFSMLWIKETWPRRLAMFLAGAAFSRFGTYNVSEWLHLDAGFTGFLLGLFGMAIVAKTFQAWETLDLSTMLRDWMRKIAGLPPKES